MGHRSAPEDLALHGVRVLGFPTAARVADRFGLRTDEITDLLLDFEACGWVRHSRFGGDSGWSLTDAGREENERHAPDRDSCHLVWIQFHEDLLATLGIPRGTDTDPAG